MEQKVEASLIWAIIREVIRTERRRAIDIAHAELTGDDHPKWMRIMSRIREDEIY